MAPRKTCTVEGCSYPKKAAHPTKCYWHWVAAQPPDKQTLEARRRLSAARRDDAFQERGRVPESQWPAGERWCSGCQGFVPLFYTRGSRCVGCESRAAHASHVRRTYDLDPEDYERLLAWQGGRCFICGNRPVSRRLAVDHDHLTGRVRGLLCADNEWGCNNRVLGTLEGKAGTRDLLEIAKAIVAYFEMYPLDRMLAGQPPLSGPKRPPGVREHMKAAARGETGRFDHIEIHPAPEPPPRVIVGPPATGGPVIAWPPGFEPR